MAPLSFSTQKHSSTWMTSILRILILFSLLFQSIPNPMPAQALGSHLPARSTPTYIPGSIVPVTVAAYGSEPNNGTNYQVSISANGQFVAFWSAATNLVSDDTNGQGDVFVRDMLKGVTTRVNIASDGSQANSYSYTPSISGDGRYVAFASGASNLVVGDTNSNSDIFVHDLLTGATTRVNLASDGSQAFNNYSVYGTYNYAPSGAPSISGDGRYVAFESLASNLVPGDTNGTSDIFVHDMLTGTTQRVSIATDGTQGNASSISSSISDDGRYVAFGSSASNLVPGDTNGGSDIFVHDMLTGTTTRVSVASDGRQSTNGGNTPSISANGRYVGFESTAQDLAPGATRGYQYAFIHDTLTGSTMLIGDGNPNDTSDGISLSADGRVVAFRTWIKDVASGYFVRNETVVYNQTTGSIISVDHFAADGTISNCCSEFARISANGHVVAFGSDSTNLVAGNTFDWSVYWRDLMPEKAACDNLSNELKQKGELDPSLDLEYYAGYQLSYPDTNYGLTLTYADRPYERAIPCRYTVDYQTIGAADLKPGRTIPATVVRFAGSDPLRILNYAAYYATGPSSTTNGGLEVGPGGGPGLAGGDNRHNWCFSGDNFVEYGLIDRNKPALYTPGYNVPPLYRPCNVDTTEVNPLQDFGPCATLIASVYRAMHYYNTADWSPDKLASLYYGVKEPSDELQSQLGCTQNCSPSPFSRPYTLVTLVYHDAFGYEQKQGTSNPASIWIDNHQSWTWRDVTNKPKPGDLAIMIWGNADENKGEHKWSHIELIVGWGPEQKDKFTGKNLYSSYDNIPWNNDGPYVPYVIDRGDKYVQPGSEDYARRGPRPYDWYYSATSVAIWVANTGTGE